MGDEKTKVAALNAATSIAVASLQLVGELKLDGVEVSSDKFVLEYAKRYDAWLEE